MDPYKVLGVDDDASNDEMRVAYRRLTRIHHPDRHANASPTEQAMHERRMAEVTGAWRLVNDPAALARHRARTSPGSSQAAGTRSTDATGGKPGDRRRSSGSGGATAPTSNRRAGGFDYRDAAASEFTVTDQGRWARTPDPPGATGTAGRYPGGRPTAGSPATGSDRASSRPWGRRLLGWVFWLLVIAVFAGGAWVAFTAQGQDAFDRLVGNDSGTSVDGGVPAGAPPGTAAPGSDPATGAEQFAPDASGIVDLAAGSCFNLDVTPDDPADPSGSGRVTDISPVACAQPHTDEAIAAVRLPGGPNAAWPGRSTVLAELDPVCDEAFRVVMGRDPIPQDPWQMSRLSPSPDSWAAGDRRGVCTVARTDRTASVGSLAEGSLTP